LIFAASSVTDEDMKEMLSAGAKGVLRKALSIDELLEADERFRMETN
jgi:DNA-binding NarL/FixJ family response regulator